MTNKETAINFLETCALRSPKVGFADLPIPTSNTTISTF